jgi:site-specific recombinase XerD
MALEPIDPETGLELFLADRENQYAEATVEAHQYRLSHFLRWCEIEEIDNLNEITGRQLHEYRLWRRQDGDLSPAAEKTQMDTVRVFIRWLESIDGVEQDLSTKVQSPSLSPSQNTRDVMLEPERAEKVLDNLATYQYASFPHVLAVLLWRTMMRTGGVHALDLEDFNPDQRSLRVRHRPETGTPVKNRDDGERLIALNNQTVVLLEEWISVNRPDTTEAAGRNPLLTTTQGRASKSHIRTTAYKVTRPCEHGSCPHDREVDSCEGATETAAACPSSLSPHTFRRGAITNALTEDIPQAVVEERANVSGEVLNQHYDQRDEKTKMEQRRKFVDKM